MRLLILTAAIAQFSMFGPRAGAQTWDGSSSSLWTDGANWAGNAAPGANATAVFDDPAAGNLANTVDAPFSLRSLVFGASQTAPVTITVNDATNTPLVFYPGTVTTVSAGSHTLAGPALGAGTVGGIVFTHATAPVLNVSRAGDLLTFSWAAASSHYRLQAQTNALNVGLGSTWADYPGGSTSPVTVPINPGNPTVFYRLVSSGPVFNFSVANGASLEIAGRMRRTGSAGTLNFTKTGAGTLFLSKDNGGGTGWLVGGDTFTVNEGILKMGHRARGNSGMKFVVNNGATLQVDGEEAIPERLSQPGRRRRCWKRSFGIRGRPQLGRQHQPD